MKNVNRRTLGFFMIGTCVVLIIITGWIYFNYLLNFQFEVIDMKVMEPDNLDVLAREREINRIFLFCYILFVGFILNIIGIGFLIKKRNNKISGESNEKTPLDYPNKSSRANATK